MLDIYIERAIAVFGMSLWLLFPMGMLVSFIRQHRSSHQPSLNNGLYHYAFFGEADDQSSSSSEKERDDSFDDQVEGENGLLHYLKGREKLHDHKTDEDQKQ